MGRERENRRTGERRESNAYGGSVMGNARSKEEARGDAERREDMLAAFTDMAQGKFLDKVAHVTSKDIKNLPVDKYVLVDVREDALRKVSHIPGSITQGDFERKRKDTTLCSEIIFHSHSLSYTRVIKSVCVCVCVC